MPPFIDDREMLTIYWLDVQCIAEPEGMVEEEHTGEAGGNQQPGFMLPTRCPVQVLAKKLAGKPAAEVAEDGAEGVGDEVVNVAGAVGEQLGAFNEQRKCSAT